MKKGFLSRKRTLRLTKAQQLFGVLIGVGYAICFYAFMLCLREMIRYMSHMATYDAMITLSRTEAFYYNFFTAFWACLMGFSFYVEYWATRGESPRIVRYIVLNDVKGLQWYFNLWFLKLALLFGLFCMGMPVFEEINFYSEYWYLFPLFLIVLFLNQWHRIRLYFKDSLKWMVIAAACFIVFSTLLAFLPIVDSNKLSEVFLKQTPQYYIDYQLPSSKVIYPSWRRSLVTPLYIGHSRTNKSDKMILVNYNQEISINEIHIFVAREQDMLPEFEKDQHEIHIYVDKLISTKLIKDVFHQLRLSHVRRVKLITDNKRSRTGIIKVLSPYCAELVPEGLTREDEPSRVHCDEMLDGFLDTERVTIRLMDNKFVVGENPIAQSMLLQFVNRLCRKNQFEGPD